MTTADIQKKIEEIENASWDAETASGLENKLLVDFIRHVEALGIPELSANASLILEVDKMKFARW
jgi:hypothetical protein